MPAMASAARHGFTGVIHLPDVVRVDVLGHFEHQTGRSLFLFRVIREVQSRPAIRADVIRISRMTSVAMRSQSSFPAFHDVVNLLSSQILW